MADIPPQRRSTRIPGRKPRQPSIKADEKAAIDKTARDLARQVNEELDGLRAERPSRNYTLEERLRRNKRAVARRRKAREKEGKPKPVCKGYNIRGGPCGTAPLVKENWEGPTEITGLYCIHHEPNITRDETDAYLLHGSPNMPVPRRITAGELAHQLITRAPEHFLRPYLKALGLKLNDENQLESVGTGLKLYGYSRGGEVMRSQYQDLIGQVNVAEKLWDRIYGKPRQSLDLASTNTSVAIHLNMDVERVGNVASVLAEAGALPLPNGNGNGHVVESTATDLLPEGEIQ